MLFNTAYLPASAQEVTDTMVEVTTEETVEEITEDATEDFVV